MKTLFLLRHAEADNPKSGQTDLERALNERGKREARTVGTFAKKQKLDFDLVLCSTALRARETAELVLVAAEVAANVRYEQRIYEAGPLRLLELISAIEEDKVAILLVGHNPGVAELLQILTGRFESMATGALAKLAFDVAAWSEVSDGKATIEWIFAPKALDAS
jgi:phosphohistidine phosphatase